MNGPRQNILMVRGGRVYDSATGRIVRADLLCRNGMVEEISADIPVRKDPESSGDPGSIETIDASGRLILPGLVDFHTHLYWGGTPLGVNPEKLLARSGVFTFVDFGSAGAANFEGFYYHVIKPSRARILAMLNLSLVGLTPITRSARRFGELSDTRLMDVAAAIETVRAYPETVRGIKVRLGPGCSSEWGSYALKLARKVADRLALPLAVHATQAPPFLDEVFASLSASDIFTHCYCHDPYNRIFSEDGRIEQFALDARRRGVKFDLGHGVSNFTFELTSRAVEQEFLPDFISSDVHAYNIDGPVFDLPTTVSKMVAAGLSLEESLQRCTSAPAEYLGLQDVAGTLSRGGPANFSIAEWRDNEELVDSVQKRVAARRLLIREVYLEGEKLEAMEDGRPEGKRK